MGKEHPDTLSTQLAYISLMINMKKAASAFRLLKNMENQLFARSFQELYTTSQDRVHRLYLQNISIFQSVAFSFALKYSEAEHHRFAANVMLRWKQAYSEEISFQHRFLNVSNDPDVKQLKEKLSAALYQLLFAQFDKHLKGVKILFIAPDGFLHLVPFHSLRLSDGKFMTERYQINYVQTCRDVLTASSQKA